MEYQILAHIIVLILASWRLSCLFVHEDGPFHIFKRLRFGREFCFDCVSVWVSGFLTIFIYHNSFGQFFLITLAVSAGAIIVERLNDALY